MNAANPRPWQGLTALVTALNAAGVVWVFALTFLICADIAARCASVARSPRIAPSRVAAAAAPTLRANTTEVSIASPRTARWRRRRSAEVSGRSRRLSIQVP